MRRAAAPLCAPAEVCFRLLLFLLFDSLKEAVLLDGLFFVVLV